MPLAQPRATTLMTLREVAAYLRVSVDTITRHTRRAADPLPALKVGRRVLVPQSALEDWLERRRP